MFFASLQVWQQWARLLESSRGVFATSNWIWLGLGWLALKAVHEFSHGLVCKRFGGTVREAGVLLVLLTPIAYVDVTSSWRFSSRWQRILTAAAGMHSELLVAAVASLIWCRTSNSMVEHVCFNVAVMASVTTVLFNLNPLMRFDGYYILSDLIGLPNLYSQGQIFLQYLVRRYVLGLSASLPDWSPGAGLLIRVHSIAALLWRMFISAGLIVAANTLFYGAGVVMAAAAVALWAGVPLAVSSATPPRAGRASVPDGAAPRSSRWP